MAGISGNGQRELVEAFFGLRIPEVVPLDCLTLDRTITIAGLEMMNIEAKRQVESQYIDQFIQDWLLGRFHNLSDLRIRSGSLWLL